MGLEVISHFNLELGTGNCEPSVLVVVFLTLNGEPGTVNCEPFADFRGETLFYSGVLCSVPAEWKKVSIRIEKWPARLRRLC